jgi:23S rRNA (pseudouridine1915-N3)-methyltransferase
MKIRIITIGKPKGEFEKIFSEYKKRLSGFVNLEVFHVKENKDSEKKVLKLIEKTFVVLLDEKGKNFSSKELADFLEKKENNSVGEISFLIGGTDGHSQKILEKKDYEISFSKLTFPHDMAMIILVETLYRSFSILKNHPYHRE